MHTGETTTEYTYQNYFSHAGEPAGTPTSPLPLTSIRVHPVEEDNTPVPEFLDVEQQASAAILAQEAAENIDDDDDFPDVPQTMSASMFSEPISVSPAAMFLLAFNSPRQSQPPPDAEGQVVSGFTLGPIVGYGAFSTIRTAVPTSGGVVAVKIIRRSDHFKQGNAALTWKRIKHEASVWSTLSHEHTLPLFSAVHTTYADYFFTLYCPVGSLFDILKRDGRPALPQDDAGMMFRQVVRGLRYLHEVALLVHRDIKLENVLVDESGVCRIADFGMTRKIGETDEEEDEIAQEQNQDTFPVGHATIHRAASLAVPASRRMPRTNLQVQIARHRSSTSSVHTPTTPVKFQPGSLPYAAPELLLPHAGPLLPYPAQDIWALGVLLYGLLTGRLPFTDSFEPRLQMKILNGAYDVPPDIGRGGERVLQGCLDRSDETRWTIAMVDEVAWSIGWGAEGDDVTPADSDEEFQVPSSSRSRSRCPPEDTIPEDPEWQHEEPRSRPAMEAASRRSSSRLQRSVSRAPVMVSNRSSSRPMLTRSVSRPSRAQSPSVCALNVTATSARSPSSARSSARSPSSSRSAFYDMLSPPTSLERGRRRQKPFASRSPSPSITPSTPIDAQTPFSADRDVLNVRPDDVERSASRGRAKYSRGIRTDHHHLYLGADTGAELDVLDETADWAAPSVKSPSYAPTPMSAYVPRRIPRSQSKPAYDPSRAFYASKPQRLVSSPPTRREMMPMWSAGAARSGVRGFFPASMVQPTTAVDRLTRSRSLEAMRL